MANTFIVYPAETGSTTDYSVPFEYLSTNFVKATVDGVSAPFTFLSTYLIRFEEAPVGRLMIYRDTDMSEPINVYSDGSVLIDDDLNASFLQSLHIAEEGKERALSLRFDDTYTAVNKRITEVANPIDSKDAANKQYVDGKFAADVANVEADRIAAETARTAAETARDVTEGLLEDTEDVLLAAQAARDEAVATASSFVGDFPSKTYVEDTYRPSSFPLSVRLSGYYNAGDGGGALYRKVETEPTHAGKLLVTLDDESTTAWYEIAEDVLTERMFGVVCDGDWEGGGTDSTTALVAWASCPVSNIKRFTGVSKATGPVPFIPGVHLEGRGDNSGIDFSAATSIPGSYCIDINDEENLVRITDLSVDLSKGSHFIRLGLGHGLKPGDWICLYNPTDYSWGNGNVAGNRASYREGEWARVQNVNGTDIRLTDPLWSSYTASAMEVYRLDGVSTVLRNFRVKPPYLSVASIRVVCSVRPVIENVNRTDGSEYAGIVLERCVDVYANCSIFQMDASGTPNNEYALMLSSCHGGEIHGSYYSQRHGLAFGNRPVVCCVPNRKIIVYANTSCDQNTGSLDFGHGCSEGLTAVGGTHVGVAVGGKNHRLHGCRIRKGNNQGEVYGLALYGSEFIGGTIEFYDCIFENMISNETTYSNVHLVIQAMVKETLTFRFIDCTFYVASNDVAVMRIQGNNTSAAVNVEVENPRIFGGASVTHFCWFQMTGGSTFNCPLAVVRGVKGLSSTATRFYVSNGATVSKAILDPQYGEITVNGNTASTSVSGSISYDWAYPTGIVPRVNVSIGNASLGGKRVIPFPSSVTASGATVTIMTTDTANFANTNQGTIRWETRLDA